MLFNRLTDSKIKKIHAAAVSAESVDEAWDILAPLLRAQATNQTAAEALIDVVGGMHLHFEQASEVLSAIYDAYHENDEMLIQLASVTEAARDIDLLNDAPPVSPFFSLLINRLSELSLTTRDTDEEIRVIEALSSTTRLMARQYDALADENFARLVELLPGTAWAHYNQGLFFKTRGRFSEGLVANQKAMALLEEPKEAYQWNLGICATGAAEGEIALQVWKDIEQKIEMGRFDLPEGSYPSCKVRLAERPLAQRDATQDDPGQEETIWIERLSPCHGIVRSVLYYDLGVDYGDVILFDGAPITYHKYGDKQVPVFPHLATLSKQHYQFYHFAGTQQANGMLANVSEQLESDAIVYSHTEKFKILCAACWRNENTEHEHTDTEQKQVVTGYIAAPPGIAPGELLRQIDTALKDSPENRIFSPGLCEAAGLQDRARIEERRYHMLCETLDNN